MSELTVFQISLSTADDEVNYFTGSAPPPFRLDSDPNRLLPPGTYRVLDGRLCRIVSGVAPRHNQPIVASEKTP